MLILVNKLVDDSTLPLHQSGIATLKLIAQIECDQ